MDMIDATWRKSSFSSEQGDACVEVAMAVNIIAIRDSNDPGGPKLIMNRSDFRRFTEILKDL
ncbi:MULTISPECIES: DUF397 domain-containing protein [unclassified Spirillospora]|uniref:DUF397 domain-containing protein n=1 Tax=unclassified Spirillospora TaxID=2642701 RepID=UPI0037158500